MLLAVDPTLARITATPAGRGRCPQCQEPVIAKCGEILVWHWSHRAGRDCDRWSEPETDWHRTWKARFPTSWIEVCMGPHRADVRCPDGTVVEFQHSPLAPADIRARETFYRRLVWIFDLRNAHDAGRLDFRQRDYGWSFRWKHPRKSLGHVRAPMYWDLGEGALFHCRRLHPAAPCGGWGRFVEREELLAPLLGRAA